VPSSLDLDDGDSLRRAYVDEGRSLSAIASMAGCSYATVRRALLGHGIEIRRSGPAPIESLRDKGWLQAQAGEGRSAKEIAELLGCAEGTVRSALQWAGVPAGAARDRPSALDDALFLEKAYVTDRRSVRSIAEEVGCTKDAVLAALRAQGVPIRSRGRSAKPAASSAPAPERDGWLAELRGPRPRDEIGDAMAGAMAGAPDDGRPAPAPAPEQRLERQPEPVQAEPSEPEPEPEPAPEPQPQAEPEPVEPEPEPEPEPVTPVPEAQREPRPPEPEPEPVTPVPEARREPLPPEPAPEPVLPVPESQREPLPPEPAPEPVLPVPETQPAPLPPEPAPARPERPAMGANRAAHGGATLASAQNPPSLSDWELPITAHAPRPENGATVTPTTPPLSKTEEQPRRSSFDRNAVSPVIDGPPARVDAEIDKIEAMTFSVTLRGYDRQEVDAFLRAVARDYRQVVTSAREAVNAARAAAQVPAPPPAAPAPAPAPPAAPAAPTFEDIGGRVTAVLNSAAEAAGQIKESAETEALAIRQRAREEAERLRRSTAEALAQAEQARAASEQQKAEAEATARSQAELILAEAQRQATQLEAEARERLTLMDRTVRANIDAVIAEARRDYEHLRSAQQQCIDRLASVEFLAKHARDGLSENSGQPLDELL
jgi:DivIVA domain-containing protein